MKETPLQQKLKEYIKSEYGATCHKYHGGVYSETAHADLYGTLPGGKAYYIEVKVPGSKHKKERIQYQKIFMYKERLNGALVGFAESEKDVDKIFNGDESLLDYEKRTNT